MGKTTVLIAAALAVGALVFVAMSGDVATSDETHGVGITRERGPALAVEADVEDELAKLNNRVLLNYNTYQNCTSPTDCAPSASSIRAPARPKSATVLGADAELEAEPAEETAPGCIGFCFNAIVKSVDERNPRIASVLIIRKGGTRTQATVERSRVSKESRRVAREGLPVRFACFDRFDSAGAVPRFEDCVQMKTTRRRRPKPEVRDDPFENPLGDHPMDL
jgi:hypothetical protein